MRLGIIGLAQSGKSTVFEALSRTPRDPAGRVESKIASVKVPDERVETLSAMYKPKKTIFAQVEYFLPGLGGGAQKKSEDESIWNSVRACDALIHVVRNFKAEGLSAPAPADDFAKLDHEMIFADLLTMTKRLERINADKDRGKKIDPAELAVIDQVVKHLEGNKPLRRVPELAASPLLKSFTLVSAKPTLVLFNNDDTDDAEPKATGPAADEKRMVVRGRLEAEIAQMPPDDAKGFLAEFGISSSALDRVIRASYELLGLASFFTVGEDEVRAWTIHRDTVALDAADCIHSDIRRGFIRAEVLAYDDLISSGTYAEARKLAKVRLEGKTYPVKDGDIIEFRFNA